MIEKTITSSGWRGRRAGRARLAIMVLTCSGAVLIAGCSSSGPSSDSKAPKPAGTSAASRSPSPSLPASASASAAACVHINSLRTSLTSLTHITVNTVSASKLTTDLANIESQLGALKGEHLGAFSPQAKELMAKLDKIKKDAAELSASPAKAAMALNGDLTSLKSKAGPMIAEMKVVCHAT